MNILFICNGNVARSQEAEAFLNRMKGNAKNAAFSAGINVVLDEPINPLVVFVMQELGYDVRNNVRKVVNEAMVGKAQMIVSFKPAEELPAYINTRADVIYWTTPDPRHQSIEFHREVRDDIKSKVSQLITLCSL